MTTPRKTDPGAPQTDRLLRYLAGAMDEAEVASLSEAMRTDAMLRRIFADLLLQHVHLSEIGKEAAARRAIRLPASWKAALSAAAAVFVAIAGWVMLRGAYPPPHASGTYRLADGNRVARGATLMTEEGTAGLVLGAYCRLGLAPHTTLRIEGKKRDESVFLEKGGVVCDVSPREGAFTVRTRIGTVSVTGTKFEVRVAEKQTEGDEIMNTKSSRMALVLAVSVMSGSVTVQYGGRTFDLGPGATRAFAEEKGSEAKVKDFQEQRFEGAIGFCGMLSGRVVSKAEDKIVIQVVKIDRTWKESKAKNANCLVTKQVTIRIDPQLYSKKGNDYLARVRKFFDLLKVGETSSFDVRHSEGDVFTFLELDEAQNRRAEQGGAGEERSASGVAGALTEKELKPVEGIPEALKGFQGMMSGTLVKKDASSLVFKVEKILRTWEHNKAKEPQAAIGLAITLNFSGMIPREKTKLMGNYREMKPGDSIELDAADQGGRALTIQESLNKIGARKE